MKTSFILLSCDSGGVLQQAIVSYKLPYCFGLASSFLSFGNVLVPEILTKGWEL
jgi:hypothetical protein